MQLFYRNATEMQTEKCELMMFVGGGAFVFFSCLTTVCRSVQICFTAAKVFGGWVFFPQYILVEGVKILGSDLV